MLSDDMSVELCCNLLRKISFNIHLQPMGSITNYVNSQGEGRGQNFRKKVHVIRVNLCSHEGAGGQKYILIILHIFDAQSIISLKQTLKARVLEIDVYKLHTQDVFLSTEWLNQSVCNAKYIVHTR